MESVKIKKVIQAQGRGFAVLLGNEKKVFPIFVGSQEGEALLREIKGEPTQRPMTHDLLGFVINGFSLEVKKIVISNLINNTFYATLILEQRIMGKEGEWTGKRNEVRIDSRPSDCLVLALKEKTDIWVEDEVFGAVANMDELLTSHEKPESQGGDATFFEVDEDIDFDLNAGDLEGESDP